MAFEEAYLRNTAAKSHSYSIIALSGHTIDRPKLIQAIFKNCHSPRLLHDKHGDWGSFIHKSIHTTAFATIASTPYPPPPPPYSQPCRHPSFLHPWAHEVEGNGVHAACRRTP
ncbi:hypothetical protein CEXT_692571 [Caerostris extrusa]|uniref:Uncharacterized protein n=1 Tax=Caerostris extrusa TaxID=172846 RepID=A0AAV4W325_CAEEX|nr:hypothetical protein CEXT_692571 [Caerostris extrusa]